MVYRHAHLSTLMLLHFTFMLSLVKMLLKREVGSHALNSHGNYVVDHGKFMKKIMEYCVLNFFGNPDCKLMPFSKNYSQDKG